MRGRAASLAEECGEYISRVQLTQRLLEELESLYGGFRNFGFEPIRERWKAFDSTIGSWVKVSGEEEMEGKAVDIDRDGALVLKSKEGDIRRIIAGDVSLRDPEGRYT
jgi:BirA family biotin operon repressor/biotin-[acetyl-CoA-carboxylase] ligase